MNGAGAKKFGMSFETQETKLFAGISRDLPGYPRILPGKFEKKRFVGPRHNQKGVDTQGGQPVELKRTFESAHAEHNVTLVRAANMQRWKTSLIFYFFVLVCFDLVRVSGGG